MNLLFDQNISFKVAKNIQDIFIGSKHLSDFKLEGSTDIAIWDFAKSNNYCIVTFDLDFIDLSTLKGFPPKIIWLRTGNSSTNNLIALIRSKQIQITEFLENNEIAFLEIK